MVKKKKAALALFLAFAVMLQYSFMTQSFEAYAGEITEPSATEETVSSEPAPAETSTPVAQTSEPAAQTSEAAASGDDAAPAVESETTAAKAAGDTKSDNIVSAKAQPAAVKATEPSTSAKVAANEVTLHITNILYTKHSAVNGHAVAYEDTFNLVKGQTKGSAAFINKAGGKNTTAGGLGYTYQFLNEFVLTDKDGAPKYYDSTSGLLTVKKVGYKSDGSAIVVTLSDGTTQEINENDVYISPVYKATANWYLNYNYIDNVSTGSGSWSNKDAVVEFNHTYSDPSEKTPVSDYAFRYWQDDETGVVYNAGETHTYSGAEQPKGSTKDVNIYAYWQPAITVIYSAIGNATETVKNTTGDDVDVYKSAKQPESTVDGVTFEGWYDADGNRISEDAVYEAPEITKKNNTAVVYNVIARFATSRSVQKVWDDANNADKIRSSSVTVQLYANGEPTGKTLTLSDANSWAAAFADLDAYDKDGNLIEYTINEEGIPAGYAASIAVNGTSFIITNTHTPQPAPVPTNNGGNDPQTGVTGGPNVTAGATGRTTIGGIVPTTTVDNPSAPLALNAYWALINLLCAVATAVLSVIMLIRYFGRRTEEDEETGEETEIKRKGAVRLASIIPAIGAIIAFILTEDMSLPMTMVDKWTIMMVVILAVQCIVAIAAKKKSDDTDGEMAEVNA